MLKKILPRLFFIIFAVIFAIYSYTLSVDKNPDYGNLLLYALASFLTSTALVFWEYHNLKSQAKELVAVVFGLTAGLIGTALIVIIITLFLVPYNLLEDEKLATVTDAIILAIWQIQFFLPLILATCLYIGVTIVLKTKDDFRFLLPYIDFSQRGTQEGGILLDSSALIDGRIIDISNTGIITAPLIIPDYVLREIQSLADGKDKLKRERGRRGLDIASELRKMENIVVSLRATEYRDGEVDNLLLKDAKGLNARILTTDFNLNKLSKAEGVKVVNINDMTNALKPQYIAGDLMNISIIKKGQEEGQGVGYLEDGTMVVVEGGQEFVGKAPTQVKISGSIQTSAGRMIFGMIAQGAETNEHQ